MHRRQFHQWTAAALATQAFVTRLQAAPGWQPRYMLASCLYGYLYLGEILPEVRKTGATALDLWPKKHGNQREQLDDLGEEKFLAMLAAHDVQVGCITQYPLGPFRLQDEMRLAHRLGCPTLVTGAAGPHDLSGSELKQAVRKFTEQMKPHLEVAEQTGVTIAIENHAKSLIDTPDSLKWLAELTPSPRLKIAFAPYHLPQDTALLAELIRHCGQSLEVFYAWEHGEGCMQRLPKEQELMQLPGRGPLDFTPLLQALADINYQGWMEIFMHPFPRGIPILETAQEITDEINRSRKHLAELGQRVS